MSQGGLHRSRQEVVLGIPPIRCHGGVRRRGRFSDCLADDCEGAAVAFWHGRHRRRRAVETDLPGEETERKASCLTDVRENMVKTSDPLGSSDQSPFDALGTLAVTCNERPLPCGLWRDRPSLLLYFVANISSVFAAVLSS